MDDCSLQEKYYLRQYLLSLAYLRVKNSGEHGHSKVALRFSLLYGKVLCAQSWAWQGRRMKRLLR